MVGFVLLFRDGVNSPHKLIYASVFTWIRMLCCFCYFVILVSTCSGPNLSNPDAMEWGRAGARLVKQNHSVTKMIGAYEGVYLDVLDD